ncbi:transglutaminase domain-containing protein [Fulvivirga sp. 29W222]|uniref:Transglutaminase domain-containing protein n=1 Tax=Fulvivirga marina TaxID=2494733 RepID=A0A937KCS2_9BACT|nr:transglutaminase-like domain-containing protein [Fulvivirga marina]MBL6448426.1 transglutaminase domain-containing protein [Fulvivirga marina]
MTEEIKEEYLKPGVYINSDHRDVIRFAQERTADYSTIDDKIKALYYAVRDEFWYDPYRLDFTTEAIKASHIVSRDYGYCIEKSCLFAAGARALGVPARMGFANVKNHIGTAKLEEVLKTNLLVFHGYAEVWLNDRWVKATPVFNKGLCNKLNVDPLEFDGYEDAVFQQFSKSGGKFMEYVHDYGTFSDIPYEMLIDELVKHYPHLAKIIIDQRIMNLNAAGELIKTL